MMQQGGTRTSAEVDADRTDHVAITEEAASAGRPDSVGRSARVNLVGWDNGGGLRTDINILDRILARCGCDVRFNGRPVRVPRNRAERVSDALSVRMRHAFAGLHAKTLYDVNLFIETIAPKFIPLARVNCLIPNPEWFRDENRTSLDRMDWVLCKTRSAVDAFSRLTPRTRYLGFAGEDRRDPQTQRDQLVFLHAAGASPSKGTAAVVDQWRRHPEWPRLIVLRSPTLYDGERVSDAQGEPNIDFVTERLDDARLRRYQNLCPVHLCPSEAEGFGHLIVEAMSCAAVVVTSDGAPMNELVTPDRGVLVRASRSEPMRLGTRYFVDPADLERQITRVIAMSPSERHTLGVNARRWYEAQCASFEGALDAFVNNRSFAMSHE
jgi:glycosyltransferase involved in cell wall biosynthesis